MTTDEKEMSFTVSPEGEGKRADRFVSEAAGITRSRAQALIEGKHVLVNGAPVEKPSQKMRQGYEVTLTIPPVSEETLLAEDIEMNIIFSDAHLAVIDKPPGLVVYPAAGHESGTLLNGLKKRFATLASIGGPLRPGVVHRLDKDTSGVMVVALTDDAYYSLVSQFKDKTTARSYMALVNGTLKEDEGTIETPIGRSVSDRKRMSTKSRHGKEARTHWRALMSFPGATLVEVRLDTGRTHQIRVHFSSIGHSVLGDRVYGRKVRLEYKRHRVSFPRQMLHARTLGFAHPSTGERMEFSAEPPEDFNQAIEALKKLSG
jgi:23S rRNA pseudouridine1911/1915/1917 synthase